MLSAEKRKLFEAVSDKDLDKLEKCNKDLLRDLYNCTVYDVTPLQHALFNNWYEGAEYLLQNGATPDLAGSGMLPPFLLACDENSEDVTLRFLKLLLNHGFLFKSSKVYQAIISGATKLNFQNIIKLMETSCSKIETVTL